MRAGTPKFFKTNSKGSLSGFNEFRKNNPLPKELTFKGKGIGSQSKAYGERYKLYRESRAAAAESYNKGIKRTVSTMKNIHKLSNQRKDEK